MATEGTNIDALRFYLTGATVDGGYQYLSTASLGGYRSDGEVRQRAWLVTDDTLRNVVIEQVYGSNSTGEGTIRATSSTQLAYQAPGSSTMGTSVTCANGATVILEDGDDAEEAVRVRRVSSDDLRGEMTVQVGQAMNGPVGMDTIAAPSGSDDVEYRALILKAQNDITDIYVWRGESTTAVAWETTGAGDDIQTIADKNTAPTAVSWNTGDTYGTGLTQAALMAGATYGLWIRRTVSDGASPTAAATGSINVRFTYSGTTYDLVLSEGYRIYDTSYSRYELFTSTSSGFPSTSSAATTSTSTSFSYALTPPGSGTREYHLLCCRRNKYNLLGQNLWYKSITIDDAGDEVADSVSEPYNVSVQDTHSGYVMIRGSYYSGRDDNPADTWRYWVSQDGTNPDTAADTPTTANMTDAGYGLVPAYALSAEAGPYPYGDTIRVLVRSHRSSDSEDSSNTTPTTHTIGSVYAPNASNASVWHGEYRGQDTGVINVSRTVTLDSTYSVEARMHPGYTDLYANTTWVWRLKYSSDPDATSNGLWTTFEFDDTAISGTPSDTPIDAPDANTVYITANGTRRLKADISNSLISVETYNTGLSSLAYTYDTDPFVDMGYYTMFQVFDPYAERYVTVARLNGAGLFESLVDLRQRATTGEFE